MKIAILIMMHKNPEQVLRLLKWYSSSETVCFIHIDKKCDIDIACFEKKITTIKKEAFVIPKRISASLFSWRLVECAMVLAIEAKKYEKNKGIDFQYFQLISGQDYPIGKYCDWVKRLEKNYPVTYMNIVYTSDTNEKIRHFQRIRYNDLRDKIIDKGFSERITKGILIACHVIEKLHTLFVGTPQKHLVKSGYKCGMGAEWWTIPDMVMQECINVYFGKSRMDLLSILKHIGTPDECFFQTIYLNMGYKIDDAEDNLVHCNFKSQGRPLTGHPYVIENADMKDVLYYAKEGCFFARKFDTHICESVLDEIDKLIY